VPSLLAQSLATQDLTAYLLVFYSAIRLHGAPEALVSDNGSIFKAKQAMQIYEQLGIRKQFIAKRQPWMSYIETTSTHMRLDRYVQYLLEHPSCSANKIGVRYPKKSRCLYVRGDDVVCRRTGIHVVN
jgi:transposase InsO family protein